MYGGAFPGCRSTRPAGHRPNETTSSRTLTLAGTLSGSAISISFNGAPDTFGQLSNGRFTLDVPQPDGTLAPVTFHSASAADFNGAVGNLSQQVQTANQQEAQQRQRAAAAVAVALQKAERQIDQDAATVRAEGEASTCHQISRLSR
jgi:hypothetical protein